MKCLFIDVALMKFCYRLLLCLPQLQSIDVSVIDNLFFFGLVEQIDIDNILPIIVQIEETVSEFI